MLTTDTSYGVLEECNDITKMRELSQYLGVKSSFRIKLLRETELL